MRVAIIQAAWERNCTPYIPLNLLSLATYIKQKGHAPLVFDLNLIYRGSSLPEDFFISSARMIIARKPDVLAFSVVCNTLPTTLLVVEECKKFFPKLPVIFGGPGVAFEGEEVLKTFKNIDVIVRGEGELTLVDVLASLQNNKPFGEIPGITYREGGSVIRNPDRPVIVDLDDLPCVDYSLLPRIDEYEIFAVEAGRGCPFHCTFCSTSKMWGHKFRIKSPHKVAEEVKRAQAIIKDKDKIISIGHDHFLASRKNAEKFLKEIKGQRVKWNCFSRLESLDDNLIKKLKEANCQSVAVGIETASARSQRQIKKNLPLEKLPDLLRAFDKHDVFAELSFTLGFPHEGKKELDQTLLLALRSKLHALSSDIRLGVLTLLKGTEMYQGSRHLMTGRILKEQGGLSPVVTNLPAEISLIKKYPHIFPSFFCLKNKAIKTHTVLKLRNLFSYLINIFPMTSLVLMQDQSLSPVELGLDLLSFYKKTRKFNWLSLPDDPSVATEGLRKYAADIKSQLVDEVFMHETLLWEGYLSKRPSGSNVQLAVYDHDVFSLAQALRAGKMTLPPKSRCYVAYVPGKRTEAVRLDYSDYRRLMCA
ncbi:MAG: radical SAM protein [Candidatus Margulisiibacteriota bacterium]